MHVSQWGIEFTKRDLNEDFSKPKKVWYLVKRTDDLNASAIQECDKQCLPNCCTLPLHETPFRHGDIKVECEC